MLVCTKSLTTLNVYKSFELAYLYQLRAQTLKAMPILVDETGPWHHGIVTSLQLSTLATCSSAVLACVSQRSIKQHPSQFGQQHRLEIFLSGIKDKARYSGGKREFIQVDVLRAMSVALRARDPTFHYLMYLRRCSLTCHWLTCTPSKLNCSAVQQHYRHNSCSTVCENNHRDKQQGYIRFLRFYLKNNRRARNKELHPFAPGSFHRLIKVRTKDT